MGSRTSIQDQVGVAEKFWEDHFGVAKRKGLGTAVLATSYAKPNNNIIFLSLLARRSTHDAGADDVTWWRPIPFSLQGQGQGQDDDELSGSARTELTLAKMSGDSVHFASYFTGPGPWALASGPHLMR